MGIFDLFKRNVKKMEADEDVASWIRVLTMPSYGMPGHEPGSARLRDQAAEVLVLKGERAVEPLIQVLLDKDKDWQGRNGAAYALGEIGDARAVEPLIQALTNKKLNAGLYAARALGNLKDPRAIEPLLQTLKDEDEHGIHGQAAAEALAMIGDPALESLLQALKDPDEYVREHAAQALGQMKDVKAVEPLIRALKDGDRDVRNRAAIALGEIKDARAVEPLTHALKDEYEYVRENAKDALKRIKAKLRRKR